MVRPGLVKAFLLLQSVVQMIEGPNAVRVTGSAGPDMVLNPVKVDDSPIAGQLVAIDSRPIRWYSHISRLLNWYLICILRTYPA